MSKYITIIRPEFMSFCKDACRAATLNHLLFRIAYKCKDQPKEKIQAGQVLWYAKTELITSEMSDAWGVCKVRKEINGIIDMGLIGRCSNPTWGVDRTKHFFFGKEQCQKLIDLCEENNICLVHLGLPPEVVHLIYSSNANDKSIKCPCPEQWANDKSIECSGYNHQMHSIDLSLANDKSIEAITKNTTKISNKDNRKEEDTEESNTQPSTAHTLEANASPLSPLFENQINGGMAQANGDAHEPSAVDNNLRCSADVQRTNNSTTDLHLAEDQGRDQAAQTGIAASEKQAAIEPAQPSSYSPSPAEKPAQNKKEESSGSTGLYDIGSKEVNEEAIPTPKATIASKQPAEEKPTRARAKKVAEPPAGTPEMPANDAQWTAETILQVFEARQGRRYPNGAKRTGDRVRDNETLHAQQLMDMSDLWEPGNTKENVYRLDKIINHLETRDEQWYLNHVGRVMPHHLTKNDRIHQMVDELKRLKQQEQAKKNPHSLSGLPNWTYGEEKKQDVPPVASPTPVTYRVYDQVSAWKIGTGPKDEKAPEEPPRRKLTLHRVKPVAAQAVS